MDIPKIRREYAIILRNMLEYIRCLSFLLALKVFISDGGLKFDTVEDNDIDSTGKRDAKLDVCSLCIATPKI